MSEWRDYSQRADTVLEDRRWPMARPYRRVAPAPIAGVNVAR
jgi:hypothetical protein